MLISRETIAGSAENEGEKVVDINKYWSLAMATVETDGCDEIILVR